MSNEYGGWHHAQFRNEELIIVGHDPRRNDCLLVKLSGLPMNEASELRRIAGSRVAQQSPRLVAILQKMESPFGTDWFTYLCRKMEQRNSPVFTLPLKEIQDTLDGDQKAIFKGYGKNRINSALETRDQARTFGADEQNVEDEESLSLDAAGKPVNTTVPSSASGNLDHKMDLMLETLVDESRRTQVLLGKLIGALTGAPEEEPVPEPAPKPRRSRPAAKPTAKVSAKHKQQEVHA